MFGFFKVSLILACALLITLHEVVESFAVCRPVRLSGFLSMEYIPDGISKEQWRKMKEEEAKKIAGKDLGKVGITKFNSRSFEAWQKDGARHLFPVDPNKPSEEKPYMQRKGGIY